MGEFLSSYGLWVIFGLFFLFMMWGHGRGRGGMGCGMGSHQHKPGQDPKVEAEEGQPRSGRTGSGCH
jgi:hypothetical protein